MDNMINMQEAIIDVGQANEIIMQGEIEGTCNQPLRPQGVVDYERLNNAQPNEVQGVLDGNQSNTLSIGQNEINNDNIKQILSILEEYLSNVNTTTQDGLNLQQQLITSIINATKIISINDQVILSNKVTILSNAIMHKSQKLSLDVANININIPQQSNKNTSIYTQRSQKQGEYIKYYYLYQYMSDLDQQNLKETADKLNLQASKQLKAYNQIGIIPRLNRIQQPQMPWYKLFLGVPKMLHMLSKDQCKLILDRLNPERINTIKEFPQFNPDFQFPCTTFCVNLEQNFAIWNNFTQVHKESQLSLPQNKERSLKDIEGRFAFEQGCKWIQLRFEDLNIEWNERIAFIFINAFPPNRDILQQKLEPARVFLSRCQDTGVWDGITTYIYNSSGVRMGRTFETLHNLSPILKEGKFEVNILKSKTLPDDIHYIPPPKSYEHIIPLHNPWCNLVKNQLVDHLQKKFSPCIMYGGTYQPLYADPNYGVTGQMISYIPRFTNTIQQDQYDKLFIWSIEMGTWQIKQNENYTAKDRYLDFQPPTEQFQVENLQNIKAYPHQQLDEVTIRIYGSIHFWYWHNRQFPRNQISIDAMSINSQFSNGYNPFQPHIKNANYIDKLMLSQRDLNEQHTQTCYEIYIADECQKNLEMALRYRRAQSIKGYNSPYLSYRSLGQKTVKSNRVPTILEFVTTQINQITLDPARKINTQEWAWIPKDLIPFYDETQHICRTKKEITFLRTQQQQERDLIKQDIWSRTIQEYQHPKNSIVTHNRLTRRLLENSRPHTYVPSLNVQRQHRHHPNDLTLVENFQHLIQLQGVTMVNQVLLNTNENDPLCEWNILPLLNLKTKKIKISALRDINYLYHANNFLVEIESMQLTCDFIAGVLMWEDVDVYFVHQSGYLEFPQGYTTLSLEHGLNFARISIHNVDPQLWTLQYFVQQRDDISYITKHLTIPGMMIGTHYEQTLFYNFEMLTEQYHVHHSNNPPLVNGSSTTAAKYRRAKALFLQMKQGAFRNLFFFSSDPTKLLRAARMRCPQEARLFLRYNYISNQTQRQTYYDFPETLDYMRERIYEIQRNTKRNQFSQH